MFSHPHPSRPHLNFIGAVIILFCLSGQAAARTPPANDNFADAAVVAGSSFNVNGSTVDATRESGEPAHTVNAGGNTVWYRWVAPAGLPRNVVLTTAGSEIDTQVAVYMGGAIDRLTQVVAGPFDVGTRGGSGTIYTEVSFEAVAGQTYYIAVAGTFGAAGNFQLHLNPPLPNDNFIFWQEVVGASGTLRGSNAGATKEAGEPAHADNAGGRSVWYRWRAPVSGTTTIDTAGSNFDTLLAVYTGGEVGGLAAVKSNDDAPAGGNTSLVTFEAAAFTDYLIAVDGFNAAGGNIVFNLSAPQTVANDNIASAGLIEGASGSATGSSVGATREVGEYNHAFSRVGQTVWYEWTAGEDGTFTFTTAGSNFDTVLAVYTPLGSGGRSAGTLKEVASRDNDVASAPFPHDGGVNTSTVSFDAAADTTYLIAVGGASTPSGLPTGESGAISLRWGKAAGISGSVRDIAGDPVEATLTLSDGNTNRTFDVSGDFTIGGLVTGNNYTLSIDQSQFGFDPPSYSYEPLAGDVSDALFTVVTPTHTVTGKINFPAGADLSNVTVSLSGSASRTLRLNEGLDAEGNYIFTNLTTRGFYDVSPSSPDFTFDPPFHPTGKLESDLELLPITATPVTKHTISGRVLLGTAGQNGVVVELRDAAGTVIKTATTAGTGAAIGSYSFTDVRGGDTYTVAPAASDLFNFTPTSLPFPGLSADKSGQNFTATKKTYAVGGRVLVGAAGEDGVAVQLKNAAGTVVKTATTATVGGVKGTYSFAGVEAGLDYTVIPAPSAVFSFTPAAGRPLLNLRANQTGQDFTAARKSYAIGGRVLVGGAGRNGVVVELRNAGGTLLRTATTAGATAATAGSYSFAGVPAGLNYTVAPVPSAVLTFVPASIPVTNLNADRTGQNFQGVGKTYAVSGRVLVGGVGRNGVSVELKDAASGSVLRTAATAGTGAAAGSYSFTGVAAGLNYIVAPAAGSPFTFQPTSRPLPNLSADQTGQDFSAAAAGPKLRLSATTYEGGEGVNKSVVITVTRAGDMTTPAATVEYRTSDATASERSDYTAAGGTLRFAAGEASKSFVVLLTNDVYQEGPETFTVTLSAPTGATLDAPSSATVRIGDNDAASLPSPVRAQFFDATFFVRQHYLDFFSREPGVDSLAGWAGGITSCGADASCFDTRRTNTSAAFFLSIEFQQTGYLIYRFYKAAYGDATSPGVPGTVPVIRFQEFLPDTRRIGEGVAVGAPNWEAKLEANKQAFALAFVGRARFIADYPLTLTPTQFVDRLNSRAGGVLTAQQRTELIAQLTAANTNAGRAAVLRKVAENEVLRRREFNRAFVLMQYFGYLRRNPNDGGAQSFAGWKGWLDKLEQFGGDFNKAEMVKAFINSPEYARRFGNP